MAIAENSKKMKWFEQFTYQLLRQVDELALHKVRRLRIGNYGIINSALIQIFSLRLTYQNFSALNNMIAQIAGEIASPETREQLTELENAAEKKEYIYSYRDASNLIEITLLLLCEEVDVCIRLKQKRNEREKNCWFTSSSEGHLAFRGEILRELIENLDKHKNKINGLFNRETDHMEDETASGHTTGAETGDEAEYEISSDMDTLLLNMGELTDRKTEEREHGETSEHTTDAETGDDDAEYETSSDFSDLDTLLLNMEELTDRKTEEREHGETSEHTTDAETGDDDAEYETSSDMDTLLLNIMGLTDRETEEEHGEASENTTGAETGDDNAEYETSSDLDTFLLNMGEASENTTDAETGDDNAEYETSSDFSDLDTLLLNMGELIDREAEGETSGHITGAESEEDIELKYQKPSNMEDLLLNMGEQGLDDLLYKKKTPVDNEEAWMGWVD